MTAYCKSRCVKSTHFELTLVGFGVCKPYVINGCLRIGARAIASFGKLFVGRAIVAKCFVSAFEDHEFTCAFDLSCATSFYRNWAIDNTKVACLLHGESKRREDISL